MKVLLTLYGEERPAQDFSPEEGAAEMAAWAGFDEAAGQVTDGPFMETKEQLGGFIFLEVRDLDEAIEWSERTPWNKDGCYTEIRPVIDYGAWEADAAAGAARATS